MEVLGSLFATYLHPVCLPIIPESSHGYNFSSDKNNFLVTMDDQVNIRTTKRARNISPAGDGGNEVGKDQDISMGGMSGKGQGSTPNRGRTEDKNNRKLSCKECRRYVYPTNNHHRILNLMTSRLKLKVCHSSMYSTDEY